MCKLCQTLGIPEDYGTCEVCGEFAPVYEDGSGCMACVGGSDAQDEADAPIGAES